MNGCLLVKDATIYPVSGPFVPRGTMLIKDGKIAGFLAGPQPPGIPVLKAGGLTVIPGLVEAHSHLGLIEEGHPVEGDDANEASDPVTPHLRALDGINPRDVAFEEALQGGITTVFVTPGSANVVGGLGVVMKTTGDSVDDMLLRHPAGLKVALGENPKRVYGRDRKAPLTRMAIAGLLRENFVAAQSYNPAKRGRDLRLEALALVLEKRIPLRAHAHRADDIMTALRLAHEFALEVIIDHCTEGHLVASALSSSGTAVVVGPALGNRAKVELAGISFGTPAVLARAGVRVAITTDHPEVPIQYLSLCAALAVRAGLPEDAALRAITLTAAEILGVGDRVGSLEVGKDANFVVLDGPPLGFDSRVMAVVVDGRVVFNNGLEIEGVRP